MNVGIICTALLGLLLFGLGLYVSILRGRTRRSIGCDTNPTDPPVSYTHLTLPTN